MVHQYKKNEYILEYMTYTSRNKEENEEISHIAVAPFTDGFDHGRDGAGDPG